RLIVYVMKEVHERCRRLMWIRFLQNYLDVRICPSREAYEFGGLVNGVGGGVIKRRRQRFIENKILKRCPLVVVLQYFPRLRIPAGLRGRTPFLERSYAKGELLSIRTQVVEALKSLGRRQLTEESETVAEQSHASPAGRP